MRKHHLNRVAIWHCEAPVTVLVVWVILRVLWARKSTRVLPTDGRWATCAQSICASVRGGTNRPNYTELSNDVIWRLRTRYLPGPALDIFQPSVLTCRVTGEALMAKCWHVCAFQDGNVKIFCSCHNILRTFCLLSTRWEFEASLLNGFMDRLSLLAAGKSLESAAVQLNVTPSSFVRLERSPSGVSITNTERGIACLIVYSWTRPLTESITKRRSLLSAIGWGDKVGGARQVHV